MNQCHDFRELLAAEYYQNVKFSWIFCRKEELETQNAAIAHVRGNSKWSVGMGNKEGRAEEF